MVDLLGKYYAIEDLDAHFIDRCVDKAAYGHHAGDYVKNAYDPRFNEGGKWDKEASEKAEDLNIVISLEMKMEGTAYKIEKFTHNYPHCWRTDKPILYYPLDSWFIRDTLDKERWWNSTRPSTGSLPPRVRAASATGSRTSTTGTSRAPDSGAHRSRFGATRTATRSASAPSRSSTTR